MFEYELYNCIPEYYRLQSEQYEHECQLAHEKHLHYESNIKKLENAEKTGYPILMYGGYNACFKCSEADTDTQCNDVDDFALVICKNPNCSELKKHLEHSLQ